MNAPNDLRWLLFATVPVNGYINVATPLARGIVWLGRRVRALVTGQPDVLSRSWSRSWAASSTSLCRHSEAR